MINDIKAKVMEFTEEATRDGEIIFTDKDRAVTILDNLLKEQGKVVNDTDIIYTDLLGRVTDTTQYLSVYTYDMKIFSVSVTILSDLVYMYKK